MLSQATIPGRSNNHLFFSDTNLQTTTNALTISHNRPAPKKKPTANKHAPAIESTTSDDADAVRFDDDGWMLTTTTTTTMMMMTTMMEIVMILSFD